MRIKALSALTVLLLPLVTFWVFAQAPQRPSPPTGSGPDYIVPPHVVPSPRSHHIPPRLPPFRIPPHHIPPRLPPFRIDGEPHNIIYTPIHRMQKPGSNLIPLTHHITNAASTGTNIYVVEDPVGLTIHIGGRAVFVLKVLSAPAGGSGQTLSILVQSSCDDGQTWTDFISVGATATGTWYYPYSSTCTPSASGNPSGGIADGLTIGAPYQGPLGNRFRIRYNTNMGSGNTGIWAFQVYVLPHLNPTKDHMQ
jgi:hypothetical protein